MALLPGVVFLPPPMFLHGLPRLPLYNMHVHDCLYFGHSREVVSHCPPAHSGWVQPLPGGFAGHYAQRVVGGLGPAVLLS